MSARRSSALGAARVVSAVVAAVIAASGPTAALAQERLIPRSGDVWCDGWRAEDQTCAALSQYQFTEDAAGLAATHIRLRLASGSATSDAASAEVLATERFRLEDDRLCSDVDAVSVDVIADAGRVVVLTREAFAQARDQFRAQGAVWCAEIRGVEGEAARMTFLADGAPVDAAFDTMGRLFRQGDPAIPGLSLRVDEPGATDAE